MNNYTNSKTCKRKRSSDRDERMAAEEDNEYGVALCLIIRNAEGIDSPSRHPSVGRRIYRVVYWVEPDNKFLTPATIGLLDPIWEEKRCIVLGMQGKYRKFLNLEVVRVCSKADPGTSSGVVVVGRAQIPLPSRLYKNKSGRFGLVRVEGHGLKAEGHIALSMELRKIRKKKD